MYKNRDSNCSFVELTCMYFFSISRFVGLIANLLQIYFYADAFSSPFQNEAYFSDCLFGGCGESARRIGRLGTPTPVDKSQRKKDFQVNLQTFLQNQMCASMCMVHTSLRKGLFEDLWQKTKLGMYMFNQNEYEGERERDRQRQRENGRTNEKW